ncbi:cytochrome P450 [Novosphingobium sp. UBA1939]|uniref:cytochrome P450 n=1 Tax=Novosphingobium sp. UBA1939 TaxID=1946982 RepID=UPI0025D0E195|nr:cytochrome P450 [Novosphingobium sp. UBA1939]
MQAAAAAPIRPVHVPPELVGGFNLMDDPSMMPQPLGDPHTAIARLLDGPPIFYSLNMTRNGEGAWIVVRAEDQRRVLQDGVTFSSNRNIFSSALGETWPLIPLEIDPPEHGKWRSLLNPLLSPRRVVNLEPIVRQRAIELIEGIKAKGNSCEAMHNFAFPFAVSIFLQFLGIGHERLHEFVGWANDLLHGTPAQRTAAAKIVVAFLDDLQALRRREPADDFMTFVTQAEIDGRRMTPEEVKAMSVLLFVAGLDTVAAAIGFDLLYLAQHRAEQEMLRAEPGRILLAAEEMLRAFPTVTPIRRATRDVDVAGALIKAGDLIACPSMTANRDPAEFANPEKIDFAREDNRHVAFAYGPHRCLGSHLARREVVIGLEEWLARIPTFRFKEGHLPTVYGGFVFGVEDLMLAWD